MSNHYANVESAKQSKQRQQNEAHAIHQKRLQEARVRYMAAMVEQDLRRQAAFRRLGSW